LRLCDRHPLAAKLDGFFLTKIDLSNSFIEKEKKMSQEFGAPLEEPKKKSNTRLIIVIIVVVLLICCCCAVAAYLGYQNGDQILRSLGVQY
jgi:hypothetical protein